MPAKSERQRKAAGAALAVKRGKQKKSNLKGASKQMAKSMSTSELRRMARKPKGTAKKKSTASKKTTSSKRKVGTKSKK